MSSTRHIEDKFWVKLLVISIVVAMAISCITPCIAVDDLKDNASSDENLLRSCYKSRKKKV